MDVLARIRRTIEREHLAPNGARALVALSGGADSVALLFLLRDLAAAGELTLAGAAHLNHQLRGTDADADEAFCGGLCERIAVPFISERADVAALARAQKRSVEDAARAVRYAFLERAADRMGADVIAVAHTRDDQAETFLLRLLRGAGTRGLAGIFPRRGRIVRPLLDVDRADVREYLARLGEPFREDVSNADVDIARNRVRHELLPFLQARFTPGIIDVLAREATLARHDDEFLQEQAIELARRIVLDEDGSGPQASGFGRQASGVRMRLDVDALRSAPRALSTRVAHAALTRVGGGRVIGFDHVEQLLALADARDGAALSLPGQYAVRAGSTILLTAGRGARPVPPNSFAFSLSIPGEVQADDWAISAKELSASAERPIQQWAARGMEVGVAAGELVMPLGIRSRRPGDRFRPLGAPGVRKLQDFLVDRKVARADRETLPLVVDGRDRIVWVPGQSVAEEFRVIDPSRGVILLRVRRLGGAG